jgi:hypothetical protein
VISLYRMHEIFQNFIHYSFLKQTVRASQVREILQVFKNRVMNTWEKMIVQTTKHEGGKIQDNVRRRTAQEDSENYLIIPTNSLCIPGLMG